MGSNITIKAQKGILLEGTKLKGGGNFNADTNKLDYTAARNTSSSTKTSSTHTFTQITKVGLNAGAGAEKGKQFNGAEVTAGASLEADYKQNKSKTSDKKSTAQAGSMTFGRNINIKSKNNVTFSGTTLSAKGASIKSSEGSVKFNAARSTDKKTSSKSGFGAGGTLSVGVGDEGVDVDVELTGNVSKSKSSENLSTAKAGSINIGSAGLNVSAKKNITLEGTDVTSAGKVGLKAKEGSVNFRAAKSTFKRKANGFSLQGDATVGSSGIGVSASGSVNKNHSTISTEKAGSIHAGTGGVNIKAGRDIVLEGTQVKTKGGVSLSAKRDVNLTAAENKRNAASSKLAGGFGIGITGASFNLSGKTSKSNRSKHQVATFQTGKGGFSIKSGRSANLTGTQISSKGPVNIDAKKNVAFKSVENSANLDETNASIGVGGSSPTSVSIGIKHKKVRKHTGVKITSQSNLNVVSGGKVIMTGTEMKAGGRKSIQAKGGVEKNKLAKDENINKRK